MGEYGASRPVSNSLVLTYYSASIFPYLWIAIVPFNLIVVHLYNRYLIRFGCIKMFFACSFLVGLINFITGMYSSVFPPLVLLQYIWKDIYILLMIKQIWSLIHSNVNEARAKYFYGILLLTGSVGSLSGNLLPGLMALSLGSEKIFFFSFPFYAIAFIFYCFSLHYSRIPTSHKEFQKLLVSDTTDSKGAFALFKKSKPLIFILAIVVLMQFSTAILYYQFNVHLEQAYTATDLRTQYGAKLQSIVNTFSIFFQAIGGLACLHFLGLKRSHLLIPISFLFNGLIFFFKPMFSMITFFFAYAKAIDFSFFTLIKEMLFLPLTMDEKYRAKAVIDVFAYRTAKGAASILLIFMQAFTADVISVLSIINTGIFLLWILIVYKTFKQTSYIGEKV